MTHAKDLYAAGFGEDYWIQISNPIIEMDLKVKQNSRSGELPTIFLPLDFHFSYQLS